MQPCSLERAAAITVARTFVNGVLDLNINKKPDRKRLLDALVRVARPNPSGYCCLSSEVLQKELRWAWIDVRHSSERKYENYEAGLFLTCIVALCWDVEIWMTRWQRFHNAPAYIRDGLTHKACTSILITLGEFQKQLGSLEGKGRLKKLAPLPTKSLVYTDNVKILDDTFLPRLVEKMPNLEHVSLPLTQDTVAKALSKHCKKLKEVTCSNADAISLLTGDRVDKHELIEKFCKEGKELYQKFEPPFPDMRTLIVDDMGNNAFIPALLLQPKLKFLNMKLAMEWWDIDEFCSLWKKIYGPNSDLPVLSLRHANLSVKQCQEIYQSDSQDLARLLQNVRCVVIDDLEVVEDEDLKVVEKTVCIFSQTPVTALSLPDVQFLEVFEVPDFSFFGHLEHLQLKQLDHTNLHALLDSCPNLLTLSVKRVFVHWKKLEDSPHHRTHTQLTTLCIRTLSLPVADEVYVEDEEEEALKRDKEKQRRLTEYCLLSILRRLSNLTSLCLSKWKKISSKSGSVIDVLEAVLTQADLTNTPLLSQLQEICCLADSWSSEAMSSIIHTLVRTLPALTRMVLPKEDNLCRLDKLLWRINLDLEFKCKVDSVFFRRDTHDDWLYDD